MDGQNYFVNVGKVPKNWKKLAFPRILRDSAGTMDVYD